MKRQKKKQKNKTLQKSQPPLSVHQISAKPCTNHFTRPSCQPAVGSSTHSLRHGEVNDFLRTTQLAIAEAWFEPGIHNSRADASLQAVLRSAIDCHRGRGRLTYRRSCETPVHLAWRREDSRGGVMETVIEVNIGEGQQIRRGNCRGIFVKY